MWEEMSCYFLKFMSYDIKLLTTGNLSQGSRFKPIYFILSHKTSRPQN